MLSTIILIILFSLTINWMISLSIVAFSSEDKKIRIRSAVICSVCGIILGCLVNLL